MMQRRTQIRMNLILDGSLPKTGGRLSGIREGLYLVLEDGEEID